MMHGPINIRFGQVFSQFCKFYFELPEVRWPFHAADTTVDTYINYAVNTNQFLCLLKQLVSTHVDCHASNTNDGKQPGNEVATAVTYNNRQLHFFQSAIAGSVSRHHQMLDIRF